MASFRDTLTLFILFLAFPFSIIGQGWSKLATTNDPPARGEDAIEINAPPSKILDILVIPRYIKEWDDVPEGFTDDQLRLGSVLEWPGHAKLTVTKFEPYKHLKLTLEVTKWEQPIPDDIAYRYDLTEGRGKTTLTITAVFR
jgi:uncharacterized protein YndB with AHSA1/START domain